MYRSAKFKAKDQAEVLEFMNKNPYRDAIIENLSGSDDPDALKIAGAMK